MFLLNKWRNFIQSGTQPEMSYFLQRRIMLSNLICLLCISFNLFFAWDTYRVGLYVVTFQTFIYIGILSFFFYLTKIGKFDYSSIFLSIFPPLANIIAGISSKINPQLPIFIHHYINIQIIQLGTIFFPILFIDIRKKLIFWLVEGAILTSVIFFDDLCAIFGAAYYQVGIEVDDNYFGTRIHINAIAVCLLLIAYFLVSVNLKYEQINLGLLQNNEQKNNELSFANHQIKAKNEELQSSEEELRQNMEELEANQEFIEMQKQELETAFKVLKNSNLRINDSIRYAKRIQNAILPHEQVLQDAFKEYFVIYKPKDVISGDFYWYFEVNLKSKNLESHGEPHGINTITNDELLMTNEKQLTAIQNTKKFLAVAYCTGHGVPGAMMSMIGSTLLKEIIETKRIYEPSEILNELNVRLVQALGSTQEKLEDGMDIALCCIEDTPSGAISIKFSGAKRPLYYFDKQIHKIQGDKIAIGRQHTLPFSYQQHQILLPSNTIIYLLSDGWIDSMNTQRFRYGSLRLQSFLAKLGYLPLYSQKELLLNDLETYTQGSEQRDDILFVGVRL